MSPEEIRAEIARRRQIANDLQLSQKIWSLYRSYLRRFEARLKEDSEVVLPEVRQSLRRSGQKTEFTFQGMAYAVECQEGKIEHDFAAGVETTTTPLTLTFHVMEQAVYKFDMRQVVTLHRDAPDFFEIFVSVTAFIQGSWTDELDRLSAALKEHALDTYKNRHERKLAKQLEKDMKNFGL